MSRSASHSATLSAETVEGWKRHRGIATTHVQGLLYKPLPHLGEVCGTVGGDEDRNIGMIADWEAAVVNPQLLRGKGP